MCTYLNHFGYKLLKVYCFCKIVFVIALLITLLEVFIESSVNDWVQDTVGVGHGVGRELKMIIPVFQLKVKSNFDL